MKLFNTSLLRSDYRITSKFGGSLIWWISKVLSLVDFNLVKFRVNHVQSCVARLLLALCVIAAVTPSTKKFWPCETKPHASVSADAVILGQKL